MSEQNLDNKVTEEAKKEDTAVVEPSAVSETLQTAKRGDDLVQNLRVRFKVENEEKESASCAHSAKLDENNVYINLEKEPQFDHYRNALSIKRLVIPRRPSLKDLHYVAQTAEIHDPPDSSKCKPNAEYKEPRKLGWIEGVLMRCVLNIIGVMLYLRISWVVAQAGLGFGSLILLLSSAVVFLTALSMSAICTNGKVRAGGTYFIISRSLGPEFGGSIGIIFAVANAVSAAVYLAGFADTVIDLMKGYNASIIDGAINDIRVIGWITAVLLLGIVSAGLNFESKAQIALMVILIVSLINYLIGTFLTPTALQRAKGITGYSFETMKENFYPDWRGETFFTVLAVYFPAATGFLAGANISGDLDEPEKAIPKGTILGVSITSVLYMAVLWLTGITCIRDASGSVSDLVNGTITACAANNTCLYGLHNYFHIVEIEGAWVPLITAGVFASTLSSALASTVSAPKCLQAVARDKIFPYIGVFGKGSKKNDEPIRGYLLTFAITVGILAIGEINEIAPLISNFFMASYALINYACFDASFAKSPGFRPAFKFYNMWLSLLGAIICIVLMFFISWWNALITLIFIMLLYVYLVRRKPDVNWGDSMQANLYRNTVHNMLKLQSTQDHVKTYRPIILLLTGNPKKRSALVDFVYNITKNQGVLLCGHVIQSDLHLKALQARQQLPGLVIRWLKQRRIRAFYYSYICPKLDDGVLALLQLCGMGKLNPNIMMMGYKKNWYQMDTAAIREYFRLIHYGFDFHKAVGIVHLHSALTTEEKQNPLDGGVEQSQICVTNRLPRGNSMTTISIGSVDTLSMTNDNFPVHHSRIERESIRHDNAKFNSQNGSESSNADIKSMNLQANTDNNCTSSEKLKLELCKEEKIGESPNLSSYFHEKQDAEALDDLVFDDGDEENDRPLSSRFEKIKNFLLKSRHKSSCSQEPIDNFRKRIKKAVIDVWWLYDDGGLTVLIPHLLTQAGYLECAKVRVFTISQNFEECEEEQKKMALLLSKLRIDFSDVTIFPESQIQTSEATLALFNELIGKFKVQSREIYKPDDPEMVVMVDEKELEALRGKTSQILKARDLLLQYSRNSNLVIVTVPVPRKNFVSASVYLSWLELLCRDLPPTLLLRGNQDSVLTFYS
ncbi:Bumetanide-sensitive sodium-(potassium)-chloride cotransporter [Trichinella spiralis]|uniref:Bumetanide-sensitive sodium-(Potassium)-chloride cotransporter n=1 Tax=Trichinella spiralis TaxID=6334 RepID=A0A0V1BRV8_TRISP|nr:Bumetanide-sensitive sodium-(potassium)-chloride cotransporter [Trichinella spiralis]